MVGMHRRGIGLVGLGIVAVFVVALAGVTSVAAKKFTVNSNGDQSDDNPGDGDCHVAAGGCTLRAAVEQANTTIASDKIKFNCNAIGGPIVVGNIIDINNSLVIQGGTRKSCPIIDGSATTNGILRVQNGVVKIRYVKLINGADNGGDGGCVDSNGGDRVELKKVYFESCEANVDGGAINNDVGVLTVTGSHFYGNAADNNGGAINAKDTSAFVEISKSTFKNNIADGDGGAVTSSANAMEVHRSTFYGNDAHKEGGAIKVTADAHLAAIITSRFKKNTAKLGGALCADTAGTMIQVLNTFSGKHAWSRNDAFGDPSGLQDNLCIPEN